MSIKLSSILVKYNALRVFHPIPRPKFNRHSQQTFNGHRYNWDLTPQSVSLVHITLQTVLQRYTYNGEAI